MEEEISKELPVAYTKENISAHSNLLSREVTVNLLLPPSSASQTKYPLLVLNDGQDMEKLALQSTIEKLVNDSVIENIVVAGVVAGDRMQEYGVSTQTDYLKRGKLAKAYSIYVTTELVPFLLYKYPVDPSAAKHVVCGCSMGGLSALNLAWNNPSVFQKVGVFSGSFWWRRRDSNSRFYSDYTDRLMHRQVRNGKKKEGLKFWFQTGKLDEQNDRNKNGVIDSIDDTLDLIVALTKKGYRPFHDIQYYEMPEGRHSIETWAEAMPEFLKWAFAK